MIVIVDYGVGNLRSVWKAFEYVGAEAKISDKLEDINQADGIVVPGQGAFAPAMNRLKEHGLLEPIKNILLERKKPYLGICLGLQLLMQSSEEDGPVEGLGIIPGSCKRFVTDLKVPQMGWNRVEFKTDSPIFNGIPSGSYFYFVHSYYADPSDDSWTCGVTEYEHPFTSAVSKNNNLFAVQFHPEKSQDKGLQILKNFSQIVKSC